MRRNCAIPPRSFSWRLYRGLRRAGYGAIPCLVMMTFGGVLHIDPKEHDAESG